MILLILGRRARRTGLVVVLLVKNNRGKSRMNVTRLSVAIQDRRISFWDLRDISFRRSQVDIQILINIPYRGNGEGKKLEDITRQRAVTDR